MKLIFFHPSVQRNLTKVPWQKKKKKKNKTCFIIEHFRAFFPVVCFLFQYKLTEMIGIDRAIIMKNSIFSNSWMKYVEESQSKAVGMVWGFFQAWGSDSVICREQLSRASV